MAINSMLTCWPRASMSFTDEWSSCSISSYMFLSSHIACNTHVSFRNFRNDHSLKIFVSRRPPTRFGASGVTYRRKMAEVDVRFEMCVAMIWVPLRLWLISFLSTAAAFQLRPCPGMHIAHDRNHGRCQLRETKTKPTQKVFWERRQNGPKLRVKCSEWFWKRHRSP
jgi:hypothetical protein